MGLLYRLCRQWKDHQATTRIDETIFHGNYGTTPSQVEILTEGKLQYGDLFELTDIRNITRKFTMSNKKNCKKTTTTTRTYLKPSLSRDDSAFYYLRSDITFRYLEKKNRSEATLLNGRQLLHMVKQGLKDYRKDLAFVSDKWNVKKCERIESTSPNVFKYPSSFNC